MGLNAFNIELLKRFRFSEPIFNPERFEGNIFSEILGRENCRFLSDGGKIRSRINKNKQFKLPNGWLLKPIKNIRSSKDNFWRSFYEEKGPIMFSNREKLPLFPFQILIEEGLSFDKNRFEEILHSKLIDYKGNVQARIYPPGAGVLHLSFYLKPEKIDLCYLLNIFDFKNILLNYRGEDYNIYGLFDEITRLLIKEMVNEKEYIKRDVSGIYTIINFQGNSFSFDDGREYIPDILTGEPTISSNEIPHLQDNFFTYKLNGKYDEDLFFMSKKVGFLYLDQGLKKTRSKGIARARRCFRSHYTDAIELAFVTKLLINEYDEHFKKILSEVDVAKINHGLQSKIRKFLTINIMDPCVYNTFNYSILKVHEKLKEIPWTQDVYIKALNEFDVLQELEETKRTLEKLQVVASDWNIQSEALVSLYKEIKDWIKVLIDLKKIS